MLSRLIGDIGVSTFSVLSFLYSLANAILSGAAQGLQPLWGLCYGRKDTDGMAWYLRSGLVINAVLSVLIYGALFLFDVPVIRIFNQEPALIREASAALPLFALSFVPMALNLVYTVYFLNEAAFRDGNWAVLPRSIARHYEKQGICAIRELEVSPKPRIIYALTRSDNLSEPVQQFLECASRELLEVPGVTPLF